MNPAEYQNEQTQIDEGPCDIALPSEIKKMPADVFSKYALWKKECEEEEAQKSARNRKAGFDSKFRENEVGEGMISGDWEKLGITNDDLEPDDAFGGGAWSVGLGGPNSKFYWFKEQDTGTHFATIVDIGNGTWKIEDADGNVVTDEALKSWDEAEKIVGRMFLGPRTAHDETPVGEGHRTLPPIDSERYTERKGLEGPIRARNGKVVYYDPKEGQYYDPDTDIYISNDEWERMNEEAEGIAGALDTMRKQFNDYNQDPSNRWEKYDQYRNQRKQISKRAKDLK